MFPSRRILVYNKSDYNCKSAAGQPEINMEGNTVTGWSARLTLHQNSITSISNLLLKPELIQGFTEVFQYKNPIWITHMRFKSQARKEIRTPGPRLGKAMLYH